jgi:hypothetical protein
MTMKARLHKNLVVGLALAAALMAPIAAAKATDTVTVPPELSYIQAPGGNNDLDRWENFRGGPGGGGPILPSDYLGHELGGPGGVGVVDTGSPMAANSVNRFDWADAGVGAAFVAGIALLIAAGLLAWSKRRPLAHA